MAFFLSSVPLFSSSVPRSFSNGSLKSTLPHIAHRHAFQFKGHFRIAFQFKMTFPDSPDIIASKPA